MTVGPRSVGLRHSGFSLLELLVTLIVVVLVTSLVSLTLSSGGRDIELEAQARNIAEVAAYALDEAQLQGRDYGLLVQRVQLDGELRYRYAWRERLAEGWQPPPGGREVFAEQDLPPGVELQMALEDAPIADFPLAGGEEAVEPQVVFYASGETTAGAVDLRDEDSGELLWRLEWDLLGRFEVLRRGEAEVEPPVKPGRGFTLVEVMVALAVVAIALPALLLALSQQVDATAYLRDKSLARMVAANKLVELRILSRASQGLPSGERSGVTTMAGREWYWWLNSKPTVSDNLLQFEIDVAATEAPEEAPLFTLLAYLSSDFQGASGDDSASP